MPNEWEDLLKDKNGINGAFLSKVAEVFDDKKIPIPNKIEETEENKSYLGLIKNIASQEGDYLGMVATAIPKVFKEAIPTTAISLNTTTFTLSVEKTYELVATVLPHNADNKKVTWTSSDNKIATVDNKGLVTIISATNCTITATTHNDLKAICNVIATPKIIFVEEIILSHENYTFYKKDTLQLSAEIKPHDATDKYVAYSSSNSTIASVNESGLVTANSLGGPVTITCMSANNVSDKATFNVIAKPVSSISISPLLSELYVGSNVQLNAVILPIDAEYKTVKWTSSDINVATISSTGLLEGKSNGNVSITAETHNKLTAILNLQVKNKAVTKIEIYPRITEIVLDKTEQLNVRFEPIDATIQDINWTSSNSSVCTIDDTGLLTAISKGTTTIIAKSHNNITDEITLQVTAKPVESIDITAPKTSIELGERIQLGANILPIDAADKTIRWYSSNSNFASVSESGIVHGIRAGYVDITGKSHNDIQDSIHININKGLDASLKSYVDSSKATYDSQAAMFHWRHFQESMPPLTDYRLFSPDGTLPVTRALIDFSDNSSINEDDTFYLAVASDPSAKTFIMIVVSHAAHYTNCSLGSCYHANNTTIFNQDKSYCWDTGIFPTHKFIIELWHDRFVVTQFDNPNNSVVFKRSDLPTYPTNLQSLYYENRGLSLIVPSGITGNRQFRLHVLGYKD